MNKQRWKCPGQSLIVLALVVVAATAACYFVTLRSLDTLGDGNAMTAELVQEWLKVPNGHTVSTIGFVSGDASAREADEVDWTTWQRIGRFQAWSLLDDQTPIYGFSVGELAGLIAVMETDESLQLAVPMMTDEYRVHCSFFGVQQLRQTAQEMREMGAIRQGDFDAIFWKEHDEVVGGGQSHLHFVCWLCRLQKTLCGSHALTALVAAAMTMFVILLADAVLIGALKLIETGWRERKVSRRE